MRARATRELLAPLEDVWRFVAEPYNLSDWWPGIGGVHPDRRGLASGARWTVGRGSDPGLVSRPNAEETLLVRSVEPYRRFSFHLPRERLDVELTIEPRGHEHTRATLTVDGPFLLGPRRLVVKTAMNRLYDLVQTAAD